MTAAEAVYCAKKGRYHYYDGDLSPSLDEAIWDPEENCWAVRLRDKDIPYSCGIDCCGVEIFAVVSVI